MMIVGCDFHPKWQQVAIFDPATGEIGERKLVNGNGEAEQFYRGLPVPSLVGVESCGNSQWFVELMEQLGHAVWIGDAAQIRASYVRQQKTDRRDAAHILKLLLEARFPRLWRPDAAVRDLRQLLARAGPSATMPVKIATFPTAVSPAKAGSASDYGPNTHSPAPPLTSHLTPPVSIVRRAHSLRQRDRQRPYSPA